MRSLLYATLLPLLVLALPLADGYLGQIEFTDFVESVPERDFFYYYKEFNISEEYGFNRTDWLVNVSLSLGAHDLDDKAEIVVFQGNNHLAHNLSDVVEAGGFVTGASIYFRVNCTEHMNTTVRVYYNCSSCPVINNASNVRADMVAFYDDGSDFYNWSKSTIGAYFPSDAFGNPGAYYGVHWPTGLGASMWRSVNISNSITKLSVDLAINSSHGSDRVQVNLADGLAFMGGGFNRTTSVYSNQTWATHDNTTTNRSLDDHKQRIFINLNVAMTNGLVTNHTGWDNIIVTEEFDGKVYDGPMIYNNNVGFDLNSTDYALRSFADVTGDDRLKAYMINFSFAVQNNDSVSNILIIDLDGDAVPEFNTTLAAKSSVVVSFNSSAFDSCIVDRCVLNFTAPTGGWFNYSDVNFTYFVFGNLSYDSYVSELEDAAFGSAFGVPLNTNSSLQLVLGGNRYGAGASFGSVSVFNRTVYPSVGGVYPWFWDYNVSLANGSEFSGTTEVLNLSLFVQGFSFDDCVHGSANESVRYNHNDESDNVTISGQLEVWFRIWKDSPLEYVNRSFVEAADSTHSYCLEPRNVSYKVEALSRHNSVDFSGYNPSYRPRDFWLHNVSINGSVTNVYLYWVNVSSEVVTLKVRDFNDHALAGAFVNTYRFYPGLNEWRLVESRKMDNDGEGVNYLFAYNELYRFVVFYAGRVYVVTETVITSSEVLLRVDTQGDYLSGFNTYNNVIYSLDYTNSSSVFRFEYNDLAQQVTQGCLRVTRQKIVNVQVCEECSTSHYDVLSCAINQSVSGVYTATGYVTIGGVEYPLDDKSVGVGDSSNPLGMEGIIIGIVLIFFLTVFGAVLGGPAGALIGFDLGFLASSIMFLSLPTGVIMTVVVFSGFAIWRLLK